MMGQAERNGISCEAGCRSYESAKVAHWHNGVDRRDHRRSADESVGDNLEARVGRRRRAHDQVEIEIRGMVAEPLPAIIAGVVDDDGQSSDPDNPKAVKRQVDERAAGDRHHRLADAIAGVPPSGPMSPAAECCPDDAPRSYGSPG